MLIARHLLRILDGGFHRAGGFLALLQFLPGLLHQLGFVLHLVKDDDGGAHAVFADGLCILHPGLSLGFVRRVAVCR